MYRGLEHIMITYSLKISGIESDIQVIAFHGREAISEDYQFTISFKINANEPAITSDAIGEAVTLSMQSAEHLQYDGIILKIDELFSTDLTIRSYELVMGSVLSKHKNNQLNNIFVNQSPIDTLEEVLNRDFQINYHLSCTSQYPIKGFLHQYKESNFDYLSRLCEHWGIYYYFDRLDDNTLVFADDTSYIEVENTYTYHQQPAQDDAYHSIQSLKKTHQSTAAGVLIQGRNPEYSSQSITGSAGDLDDNDKVYAINGIGVDDLEEANFLAHIRLEQYSVEEEVYLGKGSAIGLFPGFIMSLSVPGQTSSLKLLITEVELKGDNTQQGTHQHVNFECQFKAIPAQTQFRPKQVTPKPNAISSTARIYSEYEDGYLSHRDERGRYKIVFDYLEHERVSHWIRKSQPSAKDNHMDMALLPNTEVQIGYLAGNPDLPYIVSAIENSESSELPGTASTPLVSSISTTGTLQLKAKRSVSQSFQAPMDKSKANNPSALSSTQQFNAPVTDYFQLDNFGEKHSSGNQLQESSHEYNLSHDEGQSYTVSDSIDFYLGDTQRFYFGNQYREYHSKNNDSKFVESDDKYQFPDAILLENDLNQANDTNIAKEKQVGIVRKIFGNRYNHHRGHISTIFKADEGPHKTFNYGPRYIENIATDSDDSVNCITEGFPQNQQPTSSDHITRTHLHQFKRHIGNKTTIHTGNTYIEHTGDTERFQYGGMSKVTIDGTTREKDITVSGSSIKKIKAESITVSLDSSLVKKTITGNRHQHIFGSDDSMVLGAKTSLVVGPTINVEAVSSTKVIGGFKMELIFGPTLKYMLYPETKVTTFNNEEFAVHRQNAATALKTVGTAITQSAVQIGRSQLFILNPAMALVG